MIATAVIEASLLLWLVLRRLWSPLFIQVLFTLFCLSVFQFVEYQTCTVGSNLMLVRLGMVAITFLPALGWHMVTMIAKSKVGVAMGYVLAGLISIMFLVVTQSVMQAKCTGNYVIITGALPIKDVFGLYYTFYLVAALLFGYNFLNHSKDHRRRLTMLWLMIGYLSFMLPMALVYLVSPQARAGVPSIMCGFAVLLAFILAFGVAPLAQRIKD
jgi:hypothetical protein